jgi:hypothetical protein
LFYSPASSRRIAYEKELEVLGIIVVSVSEPGDASTPAGYISRLMMQVISTWYSKNLAIEVKKGLLKRWKPAAGPRRHLLAMTTSTIRTRPGSSWTPKMIFTRAAMPVFYMIFEKITTRLNEHPDVI